MDLTPQRVSTDLDWSDLVLPSESIAQLEELVSIVDQDAGLSEVLGRMRSRQGRRAQFHGPPGTGKTLAAALVARRVGADLYTVDLSAITSKYIGETEKNLGRIMDGAQKERGVLLFDEADALFGKRTQVKDAHDRYANQEVSYLLGRIEEYEGLVILATNQRDGLPSALSRRLDVIVHFPMPDAVLRHRLWSGALARLGCAVDDDALRPVAESYELSGREIDEVVRAAEPLRDGWITRVHERLA